MDFGSIEGIERQGFSGFVAVSLLRELACRQVPEAPGVYLILRLQPQPVIFLDCSTGGHFRGRDPAVPIQELQQVWVTGPIVIYIGKATVLRIGFAPICISVKVTLHPTGVVDTSGNSPMQSVYWSVGRC